MPMFFFSKLFYVFIGISFTSSSSKNMASNAHLNKTLKLISFVKVGMAHNRLTHTAYWNTMTFYIKLVMSQFK